MLYEVRDADLASGYLPRLEHKFDKLIYQRDNSESCGGSGFLSVKLEGDIRDSLRWGFTMVGTISPKLKFEEAYGYFDSEMDLEGHLDVTGQGTVNIPSGKEAQPAFNTDISGLAFSHPG